MKDNVFLLFLFFFQWIDALKAVSRMPDGIPPEWRKRVRINYRLCFLLVSVTE